MINELNKYITSNVENDCIKILTAYDKTVCRKHTINVGNKIVQLVVQFGLNLDKLQKAASLHDISVVIPRDKYVSICGDYNVEVIDLEKEFPILLHQKMSKIIAEEIFEIKDADILSAISCHTTLKDNPSKYDMALFIADKLMWDQGGVPPYYDIVNGQLNHSLEKACLTYINYVLDNGMIVVPHPDLIAARKFLVLNT